MLMHDASVGLQTKGRGRSIELKLARSGGTEREGKREEGTRGEQG